MGRRVWMILLTPNHCAGARLLCERRHDPSFWKDITWRIGERADHRVRLIQRHGAFRDSVVSLAEHPRFMAQLATKKINNAKAWTSDEDERLRKLIISNAPAFDIAADLGRTLSAVRSRAQALRISLGSSRFRMKAKGK
jgi:hypothetical protein